MPNSPLLHEQRKIINSIRPDVALQLDEAIAEYGKEKARRHCWPIFIPKLGEHDYDSFAYALHQYRFGKPLSIPKFEPPQPGLVYTVPPCQLPAETMFFDSLWREVSSKLAHPITAIIALSLADLSLPRGFDHHPLRGKKILCQHGRKDVYAVPKFNDTHIIGVEFEDVLGGEIPCVLRHLFPKQPA